jgi:hypothetical protein
MPLADVLGWIGAHGRAGVLTVRGVGSETMLHLRNGRVVECAAMDPPVRLGQFLLFHGVIDEETLDRAMRSHAAQSQRLGEVLLEMGAVGSESLAEALAAKAEETVLGTFDHATGWFTFDPSLTSLDAPQEFDMSIAEVIARGERRAKTAAAAAEALKRAGTVLRKTSKAPSAKLSSVWPLRNAYALVDGERSVDEIVLHMHGTEFHVLQRLHQLLAEGFIEAVEVVEPVPSTMDELVDRPALDDAAPIEAWDAIQGFVPVALPAEYTQKSPNLSTIEKYLLTLCDGTRDLQGITTVAPIQSSVVVDTLRALKERGWLKESPAASNH